MTTIDFKRARIKKRNENLERIYLEAEQIISEIKSEYLLILKGIAKDDTVYKQLSRKFDALKFDLTDYWFYEFNDRLYVSLLALRTIYEEDEESREDARKQFSLEHEVLTLLDMKHGVEDIKFREDFIKEVEECTEI